MKASLKLKALVGGALLMAAGSAFADTALDPVGGSIFVNLWDQTTGTSFIYDTGLNQSTFDGTNSVVNVNLASDPNWAAFVAGVTGGSLTSSTDTITYNVVSSGANAAYTSGLSAPTNVYNSKLNTGNGAGINVANAANAVTSSTTNSAYATASTGSQAVWSVASPAWNNNLKVIADAALGTALNFYSLTFGSTNHASNTTKTIIATFANTWLLDSAGNLTYNNVAAVPVPAPLGLLLAGLALMGVIARRRKTVSGDDFGGAAA